MRRKPDAAESQRSPPLKRVADSYIDVRLVVHSKCGGVFSAFRATCRNVLCSANFYCTLVYVTIHHIEKRSGQPIAARH